MKFAIKCALCGAEAHRRSPQAIYCMPCSGGKRPRRAAPDRKSAAVYKGLFLDGRWCCIECRKPVNEFEHSGPKRRQPIRCRPCAMARYNAQGAIRQRASSAVAKAIRSGALQRPTAFACDDCGRPACQYDHRDYTRPIDVVPVCRSCNVMRGPADVWAAGASADDASVHLAASSDALRMYSSLVSASTR